MNFDGIKQLKGLNIIEKIAEGGFGEVYKVKDIDGNILALKCAKGESIPILKEEFYILSQLNHPSIVKVYQFLALEDAGCYTMEFLSDTPIMEFFHPPVRDKQSLKILKEILIQILHTLHYIHRNGFVFGDLTPSHIIIKQDNTPVLIDIGGRQDIGTPDYASPEFISGHPSAQSDIYSLGIILYELLTGKKAFSGKSETDVIINNLEKKLRNIREINPSVPEEIAAVVMRMCEKDIYIRYRSVKEVLSALTGTGYKEMPAVSFYTKIIGRKDILKKVVTLIEEVKKGNQKILQIYGERGMGKTRLLKEVVIKGILSGFKPISLNKVLKNPEILKNRGGKKVYLIYSDGEEATYVIKDFYKTLGEISENLPVFFVITGNKPISFISEKIKLTPLTEKDIDEFVTISLGNMLNKKAFIKNMKEKSGGNPYVLIKSLKYILNAGILTYKDGVWQWDKNRILEVPGDITGFFRQGIKTLKKEDRDLLAICALAGKKFPLKIIESVKGNAIISGIVRLKNQGYINRDGAQYYFTNPGLRNYILATIDKRDKEKLAAIIYKAARKITGILPEDMADYAINAGDKEKAREYLISGGNLLLKTRPGSAFHFYKRAYEIKPEKGILDKILDTADKSGLYQEAIEIFQSTKKTYRTTEILLKIARLYRKSGKKQQAERIYKGIQPQKLSCDAVYEIANFYLRENEWDRANAMFAEKMEICGEHPRFLYGYAETLYLRKDYTRLSKTLDKGIKISKTDKGMYAAFLTIKSLASLDRGKFSQAYRDGIRAYKIFSELSDKQNIAITISNLGYIQMHRGIMDGAETYLKEALTYFQELNNRDKILDVSINLILVERHRGRFREAEKMAGQFKFNPEDKERIIYNLGLIYIYQGRLSRAEKLIKMIKKNASWEYELLGILYAEQGKYKEAEAYLKRSKALYKEGDRRNEVDILIAGVMAKTERQDVALEILEGLKKRVKVSGYIEGILKREIIRINKKQGWEKEMKKIQDLFHYRGYIFEYARTLYIQGKILADKGKFREALASLVEARDIFERMPANLYKNRAEKEIIETARGVLTQRPGTAYIEHLNIISRIFEKIDDYSELIRNMLDTVMKLMGAERGIIFLNTEAGEIFPAHSIGVGKDRDVEKISFTAIRETMEGRTVVVMDAAKDDRFKAFPSVRLNKIVSILSVPIKDGDRIIGSIYIDSRIKKAIFSDIDEKYLSALSRLMGNILRGGRLIEELKERGMGKEQNGFYGIIGTSPVMQKIYGEIEKVAPLNINILITGETGTGKELVAQTIHTLSKRQNGKFLTIDCSSLPENILESELFGHTKGAFTGAVDNKIGLFEEGDGGTIFLDEIGDAPPNVQGELLRVIEKGEIRRLGETKWRNVDVRIIAATNKKIEFEVSIKRFREDLYFRLNTFRIYIPPLRARGNDILLIADYFLKEFSRIMEKRVTGFSRQVKDIFLRYPWPGNVRELRNAVERGVAMTDGETIEREDIPDEIRPIFPKRQKEMERKKTGISKEEILSAIKKYPRKKAAARALGISRRHLFRLIKKYGIKNGEEE